MLVQLLNGYFSTVVYMLAVGISSLGLAEFDEFCDNAALEETKSLSEYEGSGFVTVLSKLVEAHELNHSIHCGILCDGEVNETRYTKPCYAVVKNENKSDCSLLC